MTATRTGCTLLTWDSEFWGRPIGRVDDGPVTADRLRAVEAWAADNDIACLFYLAHSDDVSSPNAEPPPILQRASPDLPRDHHAVGISFAS